MPNGNICEESFFFIHIGSLCRNAVTTCDPEMSIADAARIMCEQDISGLVVVNGDLPIGIVSIRDFRDLLAETGGDVRDIVVRRIMKTGLITIRRNNYVFEAIFKMARNNIHRLIVVDDGGKLVGMVTDTDLLSLQTRSPLYLNQEIEGAETISHLGAINARIVDMVNCAIRAGTDTRSLVQLISHFNDAFTQRIITLLERDEGIALPAGAAFLALGSEGRGEQTLRTDQDSALVYADDLSASDLDASKRFAERLVDALEEVGVPRCPGNTMASNPKWRHSLSEWKDLLEQWIAVPKGEHMVNFGMFQDFRTLHGDSTLEDALHAHVLACAKRNALFLPYVARNIVRFPPPLGMFGRIRVDKRGASRGKVDLKKAGIFAITEGASLLALEAGIVGGTTWDKLDRLEALGVLAPTDHEVVDGAFSYLSRLRLHRQLRALASGDVTTNYVDPLVMTDRERDRLREALKGVGTFLRIIRDHYKLDFISR